MATHNRVIPPGSRILVTGANGYIASHVVKQLLEQGYKVSNHRSSPLSSQNTHSVQVRGTVRNPEKASWMLDFFNSRYGADALQLAGVPDMAADNAFDAAIQGCAGVIHMATPVMQLHDPNIAIPMVIKGTTNALAAAAKAGIKRVVLTSSSTAAASPVPDKIFTMDPSTWNESAVKAAWAPPPYESVQRKLDVYSASKTQGEQAAWEYVRKSGADMVLNCVLPNMNVGEILSVEHQGWPSTTHWVKAAWGGFSGPGKRDLVDNPPQYYVNVDDDALVHVAALTFDDVKGERLFAFAKPYNWNSFLAAFRKMYPERNFVPDFEGLGEDKSIVANERAEELLKRLKGGKGWESLEESLRPLTEVLAKE